MPWPDDAFQAFSECATQHDKEQLRMKISRIKTANGDVDDALVRELSLALQLAYLPKGAAVQISGLTDRPSLNGCGATIISCLRDGSYRCAVEIQDCGTFDMAPQGARIHAANLRPAKDCAVAAPPTKKVSCWEHDGMRNPGPLTEAAVSLAIADDLQLAERRARSGKAHSLGDTAYPDMPYTSLHFVLVRMHQRICSALAIGDVDGAEIGLEKVFALEEESRPLSTELYEVVAPVRFAYASLKWTQAAMRRDAMDAVGARKYALAARALNVTPGVSCRKLHQSTSQAQRVRPRDALGLRKYESEWLQSWFDALLPLDVEEHGPQKARYATSEHGQIEKIVAVKEAVGNTWANSMK